MTPVELVEQGSQQAGAALTMLVVLVFAIPLALAVVFLVGITLLELLLRLRTQILYNLWYMQNTAELVGRRLKRKPMLITRLFNRSPKGFYPEDRNVRQ